MRRRSWCERGRTVNEQHCKHVNEGQYRDPEPEGQYLNQYFPEGFENGKFNLILWCIFCPSFINTTYWPVLQNCICFDCWKLDWIATPWLLWPFFDNLGLSLNMIYSVWMVNPARALRTRLLLALQILLWDVFKTKKSVSVKMGKTRFKKNKRKTCLDEMDGDFCVGRQMMCSYLCGWARMRDIHLVN